MSGIVGGNLGRGSGLIKAGAIDDDSVTLAKMAGLARGKLIYGDTSGDPAALAVGAADEVLTHDGTDFDWAAAGGVDDGDVTMAKLSTSGTESDNVENRVCKVWVQFNGTGTVAIQSDFNVGSISDYDTGQYGVNFSTGLGDNDFAAVSGGVCAGGYGANTRVNDLSTSLCKIDNYSTSSYTDSAIVTLVLMGNSA